MPDELIIPRGGGKPIRGIYSPRVAKVASGLGQVTTRRASHVEPTEELSNAAVREAVKWSTRPLTRHGGPSDGRPDERLSIEEMRALLPADKWWADCQPVGGPVLGPFDDRDTALQKESEWLRDNKVPTAVPHSIQIEPPTEPVLTQDDLNKMG